MNKITRNMLTRKEFYSLAKYIEQKNDTFDFRTTEDIAHKASQHLKFKVTATNLRNAANDIGITWEGLGLTGDKGGEENKRLNRKIRTVSSALLRIVDDLGIQLPQAQIDSLRDAAEHDSMPTIPTMPKELDE